ncbi:hypothetical protein O9G_001549 [Rozella allomycis CSF55]|uniref:OTU domain-containing protein n=1 Tax=Rozella allomycis (strain CSF55) TaxID=988480 RepID=A0A075B202_ROZAC|nr:hypothetical protein O9G_001549 [Rozella allomycis CSF55]|eukprot:EPZ36565.1 hypothetical protein O9G_001549 [Rozella allomycis CSF55]
MELEELQARHKAEIKDLNSKIISLKKAVSSGQVKMKKKDLLKNIEDMEKEIKERHGLELKNIMTSVSDSQPVMKKKQELEDMKNAASMEDPIVNRREKELNDLQRILDPLGLLIFDIPADGHCLYNSISHQIKIHLNQDYSVDDLRKVASDYIKDHKDDFIPFLYDDNGDILNDRRHLYCKNIVETATWGGQIEVQAIAKSLKLKIKIYQAGLQSPIEMNPDYDSPDTLSLSY